MSNIIYAFLLSTLAGISTVLGYLFIYIKKDKVSIISKTLGFASGIMITISILDLIPNSFLLNSNNKLYSLFIVIIGLFLGIVFSSIIDQKIEKSSKKSLKLYKLGIISMIVIILHNIPEGIITFITSSNNIKLGIKLSIAIALHNIPEGISISIPIYYSTKSKLTSFIYTFISGLAEPLGAFITYIFLYKYINNNILGIIYSFIAGMMINISINKLYKESLIYNKKNTIIYFIIGILIMIISHVL